MSDLKIRPATLADVERICSMVQAERFQDDGSGALLPVRPEDVRALVCDGRNGAFSVAQDAGGALVGCVAMVVYGLPENFHKAMALLLRRMAFGGIQARAGLKVLAQGEVGAGEVAELRSLVVSGSQRGKGLGADLIDAAKKEAAARGFRELYSLTNEQAVPLFERCGFTRAERTPQKLVVDCATCPILERCNEVPVVARLKPR